MPLISPTWSFWPIFTFFKGNGDNVVARMLLMLLKKIPIEKIVENFGFWGRNRSSRGALGIWDGNWFSLLGFSRAAAGFFLACSYKNRLRDSTSDGCRILSQTYKLCGSDLSAARPKDVSLDFAINLSFWVQLYSSSLVSKPIHFMMVALFVKRPELRSIKEEQLCSHDMSLIPGGRKNRSKNNILLATQS